MKASLRIKHTRKLLALYTLLVFWFSFIFNSSSEKCLCFHNDWTTVIIAICSYAIKCGDRSRSATILRIWNNVRKIDDPRSFACNLIITLDLCEPIKRAFISVLLLLFLLRLGQKSLRFHLLTNTERMKHQTNNENIARKIVGAATQHNMWIIHSFGAFVSLYSTFFVRAIVPIYSRPIHFN